MSNNWYKLDNAGIIFPPVSGRNNPNTFCLSATLNSTIDKDILEKSVNELIKSEDVFRVCLKKGFFWYYLEENFDSVVVHEEPANFMEYIDYNGVDNYLFRVFYRENRISVVFFHALTDGSGGLYFFKQLLYSYLIHAGKKINTEGLIKPLEVPTLVSETNDNFLDIKPNSAEKKIAEKKALKLSGTPFKVFGTGLIVGECEIEKIKELAKKYNTTITGYLCGLYMFSLYKAYIENKNKKNKTICISIPVNIRKLHLSDTKRNFSLVVRVSHNFEASTDFNDVIKSCAEQLKTKLTVNQVDAQIKFNTSAERNFLLRIVPRVLKNFVLKLAYKIRAVKQESTSLSNLGFVKLPADMEQYVKELQFFIQASKYTQKNLSVIGYNNKLFISFSRRHVESSAEKYFFQTLEKNGVEIVINSNYQEMKR